MPRIMDLPVPQFLLATCQVGAEAALIDEMMRKSSGIAPAFKRPGFVTFRLADSDLPGTQLQEFQPCFARVLAVSIGRIEHPDMVEAALLLWQHPEVQQLLSAAGRLDLHVWQRDFAETGESGFRPSITPLAEEIAAAIVRGAPREAFADGVSLHQPARRNAWILDVVVVDAAQWWIGYHRASIWMARWPGGLLPLQMPAHAVSRAYLKTNEALQWARPPIARGDLCAELGCAPGGSSQALLDRGFRVLGIDPAEMDDRVLAHPHFQHLRKRARDARRREFREVRWLFADMNVAPAYTLDAVEGIVTHSAVHIRGLVLTLKLLDWDLAAELPACVHRIRQWGYRDVRLRQLASAGREVCVVAMRSRAQRRIQRKRRRVDHSKNE